MSRVPTYNKDYYSDFSKKLIRIQYPGVVENVDKMVDTLGGMSKIGNAVRSSSRKLELRFQPDNVYCKPARADKDENPGVLLKLKVRKHKDGSVASIKYEVVGVTLQSFKFDRLCDFQYLPLVPKDGNGLENIYDDLFPKDLVGKDWLSDEASKNVPLFFPPVSFSRVDSAHNKLHFEKAKPELQPEAMKPSDKRKGNLVYEVANPLSRRRVGRPLGSIFMNFDDSEVPMHPPEGAAEVLRNLTARDIPHEKVKQMFEERPIWSKAAILHKTGIRFEHIKSILPCYAYYCITGPWRVMWVRFGYDPRKDPSARIYQTFDYRIRAVAGQAKLGINVKRASTSSEPSTVKNLSDLKTTPSTYTTQITEGSYVLKPGFKPPARQMFYQYCQVQLPEIQEMLSRLPVPPPGAVCDPKNGWLPARFHEQCREITSRYINELIKEELLQKKLEEDQKASDQLEELDDGDVEIVEQDDEEDEVHGENLFISLHSGDSDEVEVMSVCDIDEIDAEAVEEINNLLQSAEDANRERRLDDEETNAIGTLSRLLSNRYDL